MFHKVYECLLGLAGYFLNENYKITPFDESIGAQASRSIVYSKLYETSKITFQKWLFDPISPGKVSFFLEKSGQITIFERLFLMFHKVLNKQYFEKPVLLYFHQKVLFYNFHLKNTQLTLVNIRKLVQHSFVRELQVDLIQCLKVFHLVNRA